MSEPAWRQGVRPTCGRCLRWSTRSETCQAGQDGTGADGGAVSARTANRSISSREVRSVLGDPFSPFCHGQPRETAVSLHEIPSQQVGSWWVQGSSALWRLLSSLRTQRASSQCGCPRPCRVRGRETQAHTEAVLSRHVVPRRGRVNGVQASSCGRRDSNPHPRRDRDLNPQVSVRGCPSGFEKVLVYWAFVSSRP